MKVFKFGGASVNCSAAVKNMTAIVRTKLEEPMVVVVSAMGKTTNALEKLIPGVATDAEKGFNEIKAYHYEIAEGLFHNSTHPVYCKLKELFDELHNKIQRPATNYNYDYDQIVSYGELISTTIVSYYLENQGLNSQWIDVRKIIKTDNNFREGNILWDETKTLAQEIIAPRMIENEEFQPIIVTQGFIASTLDGATTTLGREGSDYSASILSYCLDASSMTIWKDVMGFLNADPKYFRNTVKIDQIPFNEAIELAYYGASVIHPKTVKPIQNKGINIYIKSFINPSASGSTIGPYDTISPQTSLYIFKNRQTLISIMPKDFSFIVEKNLQTIFATLAELNIRVNMMQNSALSFSLCIDDNDILLENLQKKLGDTFKLRYNKDLQLITIRYYTQEIIDEIVNSRPILLQQRSRNTAQILVGNEK